MMQPGKLEGEDAERLCEVVSASNRACLPVIITLILNRNTVAGSSSYMRLCDWTA